MPNPNHQNKLKHIVYTIPPKDLVDIVMILKSNIADKKLEKEKSYPKPMTDLLGECYRILLKSGGVFSLAVPNARIYLDAYFS